MGKRNWSACSPPSESPSSEEGKVKDRKLSNKTKSKDKEINLERIPVPLTHRFQVLDVDSATNTLASVQKERKRIISPIVVTDSGKSIPKIVSELNVKCVSVGEKIFPYSIEDKNKIIACLSDKNINFFSHPDDVNKPFKVVLSGLSELDTSVIVRDLKDSYNISATNIVMFTTQFDNKMYLCQFDKSVVNMKLLNTIKVVFHHRIKWQTYKPKRNALTQCYRCAMYGHGAHSCT